MSRSRRLKVYRSAFVFDAVLWVCCIAFFLVGLSMVTAGSSQPGAVGNVVVGVLVLLISVFAGAVQATNRLIVTADGLVHQYELRRRFVRWSEIRSFGVGPSRLAKRWPCLVIHLDNGLVTASSVAGLTAAYAARIADELSALQREFVADPPPSADRPEVGPP